MKLTQWFPGDVKPVHVGVYERRLKGTTTVFYSRWDGEKWWSLRRTVTGANTVLPVLRFSDYQNLPWRGVLK